MADWRAEYEKAVLCGDIGNAKRIVAENSGNIYLLKFFRGTMRQLNTVMSEKFWLSNAKFFNDPYDSLSLANVRSKLIYDRYDPAERKLAVEEYEKQVKSNAVAYDIQSSIFVTCFSETSLENLHMWSYYADEHKGFCVEYSLPKMIERGIHILPVVYTEEWEADRSIPDFKTQVALIKSKAWAHEKEWRIVCVDPIHSQERGIAIDGITPTNIYVGCRDQLHINDNWDLYSELKKTFSKHPNTLNYVWGNKNRKISLNEIIDACEKNKSKNISVYSMELDESGFGTSKRKVIY